MKVSFLFAILFFLWLSLAGAHPLQRQAPPVYQFAESNIASGLNESDVQFLLKILDSEFGDQIHNVSKSWTTGFDWKQT